MSMSYSLAMCLDRCCAYRGLVFQGQVLNCSQLPWHVGWLANTIAVVLYVVYIVAVDYPCLLCVVLACLISIDSFFDGQPGMIILSSVPSLNVSEATRSALQWELRQWFGRAHC